MDAFSVSPRRRRRTIHLTARDLAVLALLVTRRVETIDCLHERVFTGLSRKRALNRLGELVSAGYLKRTFADLPGADRPRSVYWLTRRAANALKLRSAGGSEWLATHSWRFDLNAPSIPHQIVTNRVCDWLGAQAVPEHLLPADLLASRTDRRGRHRPDAVYEAREPDEQGKQLVLLEVDLGHYSRKRIFDKVEALSQAREARYLLLVPHRAAEEPAGGRDQRALRQPHLEPRRRDDVRGDQGRPGAGLPRSAPRAAAARLRARAGVRAVSRVVVPMSDRFVLQALEAALAAAREADDRRPPLVLLEEALTGIAAPAPAVGRDAVACVGRGREDWLRRLRSAGRSDSAVVAYRQAIDDLVQWVERHGRAGELFEERAIVDYLEHYRARRRPAPATYHRRFLLLRRFLRWVAQREGLRDPFAELDAPPRPRQEADWLTREEFARMLTAASAPTRQLAGLVERDRLVLLALVTTGLRRSELVALDWGDVELEAEQPSLLVRRGKGGKPRRQPLPDALAHELRALAAERDPAAEDPVFTGLRGGRLQPTILAAIIRRAAKRAGIDKHVTAHTLRHTAATWLRQATGDARLVAEYLGHADLSTVSRYAHVASDELRTGAEALAAQALPPLPPAAGAREAA